MTERKAQRREASTTMHLCGVLERGVRRRPLCESLTWFNADIAVPRGVIPDRCFGISSVLWDRIGPVRLWSSRSRCRRPSTCHGCRTLFFVDLFKLSNRSTEACLSLCYPRFLFPMGYRKKPVAWLVIWKRWCLTQDGAFFFKDSYNHALILEFLLYWYINYIYVYVFLKLLY